MSDAQHHFDQAVTEQCVEIFSVQAGLSHGKFDALRKLNRNAEDMRRLVERARLQEPNSTHDIPELARLIQRTEESYDAALLALIDVIPVLTGAYGPYAVEFQHNGRVVAIARSKPERQGIECLDENGHELPDSEIVLKLRRKTLDEIASVSRSG